MTAPDFRNVATLDAHIQHTLDFYRPRCIDPTGGFFHFYLGDGRIYDAQTRHLVSSTRFVFNFAMAWRRYGREDDRAALRHGLQFLREAHFNPQTGGYAWLLRHEGGAVVEVLDGTNHCYGLAFVLLAYSHALMAGEEQARPWIADTVALMERRFWEPAHGLYADESSSDWSVLHPYRGQNANMHACEAFLAAWEATGESAFLERARLLAENITDRQAALGNGLVWEHYRQDWSVDWDYNRHDKSNIFRPWGYQPGHLTEWAKLLLILAREGEALGWDGRGWRQRARRFTEQAWSHAWDEEHGGLVYGFGPDGRWCDDDKYFWVQAETLATLGLLASSPDATEQDWARYEQLWRYCWQYFIDHQHGAWWRILPRDNFRSCDEKSPAGKTDYHTMGACYELIRALEERSEDARVS